MDNPMETGDIALMDEAPMELDSEAEKKRIEHALKSVEKQPANYDEAKERRNRVWAMRVRGATILSISEEMELSQKTIKEMLSQMRKEVHAETFELALEEREMQAQRLDMIYEQALLAWERSKQPKKSVRQATTRFRLSNGEFQEGDIDVIQDARENVGDIQYLNMATKALEDKRRLYGLDGDFTENVSPDVEARKYQMLAEQAKGKIMEQVARIKESAGFGVDQELGVIAKNQDNLSESMVGGMMNGQQNGGYDGYDDDEDD